MRIGKVTAVSRLGMTIMVLVVVFCGCNCDKPTEPKPEEKDYVFYFSDAGPADQYFRYYSATKKADTLTIPYASRTGLAVSADGDRLYLSDDNKTVVVSADSFNVIAEIPYEGRVAVSPDNELVAILGPDLRILNVSDYSVLFHDTTATYRGRFSLSGKRLYCVGGPGVITVDISDTVRVSNRKEFPGIVLQVVPSVDESKWFVYRTVYTFDYFFDVYDVEEDSIIFSEYLTPGHGEIEVTPNGRYAFYTNPGTLIGFEGVPFVTVFDVRANEVVRIIETPSPVNTYVRPRKLAITPDGHKLVAIGARGQGEFSVIDVRSLEVVEHYYLGNSVDFWEITCQNGL